MQLFLTSSKNLLSIHRFCSDDQMCVEFDFQRVRMLDPTRELILERKESGGLYLNKKLAANHNKESP